MYKEKILEEYNAVKNNVGLFDFSIESKIKVLGEGRVDFINGLVSNDVKELKNGNGVYAAFLNRFGKILSDCIVYKFDDFLLINLNIVGKNNIIKKLKDEAGLGKSKVEDISLKYGLFSLQGAKSLALVSSIISDKIELKKQCDSEIKKIVMGNNSKKNQNDDDDKKINDETEIIIAKNDRTNYDGYDIFVPAQYYKIFKEIIIERGGKYGLQIINNETYNILRLEAKIPLFGIDFDEKNILPEIGERAISYTKGCYVGQEIVARVKNLSKGITAKKLCFLEIDGNNIPEKNTKITKDNIQIGYVTSAAFSPRLNMVIAFGFLNREFYGEDTKVVIGNSIATVKLF